MCLDLSLFLIFFLAEADTLRNSSAIKGSRKKHFNLNILCCSRGIGGEVVGMLASRATGPGSILFPQGIMILTRTPLVDLMPV